MGIQERKQREREQRRELIIEAASRVFQDKGLNNATMEEIAQEAELSKATLYLYFTNKEELFLAVLLIVLDVFAIHMEQGISKGKSVIGKLEAMGHAYQDFYAQYPAYYKLLNAMDPPDDFAFDKYEISKNLASANSRIWEVICAPIIEGMQQGIFLAEINPLEIGMMLWTGSTGIINLKSHVKDSLHHDPAQCEVPLNETMSKLPKLDYDGMLIRLWQAIIENIMKK